MNLHITGIRNLKKNLESDNNYHIEITVDIQYASFNLTYTTASLVSINGGWKRSHRTGGYQ